jgi:ABC-type lipoprotein export system ATPase subunit/GNAT superfamily N-acetyltransferase
MTRKRREYFRITKFARRYDKRTGKFTFDIAYETATEITPRTIAVAEAFGLGIDQTQKFSIYDNVELRISPSDVVYITGDSGSGKSVLLRAIKQDLSEEAIDMADIHPDPDKPIIDTVGEDLNEGLELLSRAGLNDAFLFVRRFRELSDGQKYRYKIAKLMESGRQWWIADEFCSVLDRDTAKIVAFNLQKIARRMGRAVVVATTHSDLFEDLQPSVHVHKRFGKEISVNYYPSEPTRACSLVKEMRVKSGSRGDWVKLAGFHYRSHKVGVVRRVFCLVRGFELCGVIVYCYPPPRCFGRSRVLPGMGIGELNEVLSVIMRVVVHPKYRSIGLGAELVRETLGLVGTVCVEMVAVMAKYNPFAEKAGMERIAEQEPSRKVLNISEVLSGLGFNLQLLGSEKYVLDKLEDLSSEQLGMLKEAFMKNGHPRLSKEFAFRQPYGRKADYVEGVRNADLKKMVKLIRIVGVLLQSKVYLFWRK